MQKKYETNPVLDGILNYFRPKEIVDEEDKVAKWLAL
jgi:hypothetical protein